LLVETTAADFRTAGDVHDVAGDEAGLGGDEENAGIGDDVALGAEVATPSPIYQNGLSEPLPP